MARDFFINGENMVSVKGNSATSISSITQLGLALDPIIVTAELHHKDILVDAWGGEVPADVQFMLSAITINMNLVHFDRAVLDTCVIESMAGSPAIGQMPRAGTRMGGGNARFASGNRYVSLNIQSPVAAKHWRFHYSYLTGTPIHFPLGAEHSILSLQWRAIPYTTDPWGGGTGSQGTILWDHILDT